MAPVRAAFPADRAMMTRPAGSTVSCSTVWISWSATGSRAKSTGIVGDDRHAGVSGTEHGIRVNGVNPDGVVRGPGIFAFG